MVSLQRLQMRSMTNCPGLTAATLGQLAPQAPRLAALLSLSGCPQLDYEADSMADSAQTCQNPDNVHSWLQTLSMTNSPGVTAATLARLAPLAPSLTSF